VPACTYNDGWIALVEVARHKLHLLLLSLKLLPLAVHGVERSLELAMHGTAIIKREQVIGKRCFHKTVNYNQRIVFVFATYAASTPFPLKAILIAEMKLLAQIAAMRMRAFSSSEMACLTFRVQFRSRSCQGGTEVSLINRTTGNSIKTMSGAQHLTLAPPSQN
jgi:hypothetical protein